MNSLDRLEDIGLIFRALANAQTEEEYREVARTFEAYVQRRLEMLAEAKRNKLLAKSK